MKGQGEVTNVKNFFDQPADKYGNDETIEVQWAIKAYHHAEVYFSLLKTVDPSLLKLTPRDSEIYADFRETFGDLAVDVIDEGAMKSADGKAKWRAFCEQYKGRVEDYNMGTLLRLDASQDVSEQNTTLVPRIQFLAVEVARNREGFNAGLRKKYGVAAQSTESTPQESKSQESRSQESRSQESRSQDRESQETKSQETKSQESESQESKSQESESKQSTKVSQEEGSDKNERCEDKNEPCDT